MCKVLFFVLQTLLINFYSLNSYSQASTQSVTTDSGRQLAITIDDLPVNSQSGKIADHLAITEGILNALTGNKVSAIGFVNEGKLYRDNQLNEASVDLLNRWLQSGMDLGNHGYAHSDINTTDLTTYTGEIIKGEIVTKMLLNESGKKIQYYRHPFLHVGNTIEKKEKLESFLKEHGYKVAPVTIDNSEWIFARAYENAYMQSNEKMMNKLGGAYINYMSDKIAYFEQQSMALFEYEIKQVLLIHANRLNADYLDQLIKMIKTRGYNIASLDEILKDQAYQSPDKYVDNGGISWIHRWALTQGKKGDFFRGEPVTPEFVQEFAGIRE